MRLRERFISSQDTVALFSDASEIWGGEEEWIEQWTGRLVDFLSDNDINSKEEVLAVCDDLKRDGVHRTGGGAAPIFELRLIAQSLDI